MRNGFAAVCEVIRMAVLWLIKYMIKDIYRELIPAGKVLLFPLFAFSGVCLLMLCIVEFFVIDIWLLF